MSERRPLWTVVGLLALASLLLWLSSLMTWSWSRHTEALTGVVVTRLTGAQRETGLVPLALLSLALIAAVVATGGRPRQALGVIVALVGLGTLWLAADGSAEPFAAHPSGYPTVTVVSAHLLAVLAAVSVVLVGVSLVRSGHRMPRLGAKYRAPSRASPVAADPDRELWRALDAGTDPTAKE